MCLAEVIQPSAKPLAPEHKGPDTFSNIALQMERLEIKYSLQVCELLNWLLE